MMLPSIASQVALSLFSMFTTQKRPLPSLLVELRPHFAKDLNIDSIGVRMQIGELCAEADAPILVSRHSAFPNNYSTEDIQAHDDQGSVRLLSHDQDGLFGSGRAWSTTRRTKGDVVLEYTAHVQDRLEKKLCGPNIDLISEKCGFIAPGLGFLIQPINKTEYNISYTWDLEGAPDGTRAVCTFGEGIHTSTVAPATRLGETIFAAGQLSSYSTDDNDEFGLYWFENPPFNTTQVGSGLAKLARQMAAFFEDPDPLIRIFVRHNHNLCASGSALYRSFLFGWTSLAPEERSATDFLEFLTHEMVHNWPRLRVPQNESWYAEGIAEYYSIVLSYRFGVHSEQTFILRMNRMMSAYYTNPNLYMDNNEAARQFWSDNFANRILYERGFAYFVSLAAQLSHRLGKGPSLDDLIREMLRRYSSGAPTNISTFVSLLSDALGPSAADDYNSMVNGIVIVPRLDSIPGYILRRTDQERFYLGFNRSSLRGSRQAVTGLDPNSRAAVEGGLMEGDVVTTNHSFLWSAEAWDRNFTMVVIRNSAGVDECRGKKRNLTLTWWPRSWEKVPSWQWVPVTKNLANEDE